MDNYFSPIDRAKPVDLSLELHIVEKYLAKELCNKLISCANWCPFAPAPIGGKEVNGNVGNVRSNGFVADRIEVCADSYVRRQVVGICSDIHRNHIDQYYGVKTEWYEYPHILRYGIGGTYRLHSDSENMDTKTNCWVKVIDRDYSSIVYLNDEYTGGAIAFPSLNIRIQPRAGMLVAFPSDHRFLHTAEPTLSGTRYALVTWAAMLGVNRVCH